MKPQTLLSVLAIAALMLACNLPTGASQPTPVPPPTQEDVVPPATNPPPPVPPTITLTPLPTDTPTITPTATPSAPMVTPAKDPVNCRFGPGTEWQTVGGLNVGEMANVIGRTAGGNWWYIRLPSKPDVTCWVAASVTNASGDLASVNITAPPQAIVTKVSLKVKPTEVTVPGCVFPYNPIDLYGEITTNGPTIVEWHWETSQGNVSSSDTLKFDKYDTLPITDYVKYGDKGSYWVKLVVTKPNSMVAQAKYKVVCGP